MVFKALGTRLSDRDITKNKSNHSLLQGRLREMNKEKVRNRSDRGSKDGRVLIRPLGEG